jgi:(p)ppGpp synthase/HD superfamily hydrolase
MTSAAAPLLNPLVERAIELATQWHDATYRKGGWRPAAFELSDGRPPGVPVAAHVTAVGLLVQRAGWDDETVAAAFLHDVLEDSNRDAERLDFLALRQGMGARVAKLVDWVTEVRFAPDGRACSWEERKEAYLNRLRVAPVEAVAISLADKLHNLWTMNQTLETGTDPFRGSPVRKALSRGPALQCWYFESVLEIASRFSEPRLERLVHELKEALVRFKQLTAGV